MGSKGTNFSRTAFPMDPSASGSLDNFWNTFGKAFQGRELQAKLGKILLGKENLWEYRVLELSPCPHMTSLDTGLVHQTVEISMTLYRKTSSCTEECQGVQRYPIWPFSNYLFERFLSLWFVTRFQLCIRLILYYLCWWTQEFLSSIILLQWN